MPTVWATLAWLVAVIAFGGAVLAGWDTRDLAMGAMLATLFVLIAIGRLYTVALQDRIIMLEMKVRCAEVLPAGADAALSSLSAKQIVALRFASDAELGALLDRAAREQLTPDAIKQAVVTWRPDHHRT
jgi:hypothetical protein